MDKLALAGAVVCALCWIAIVVITWVGKSQEKGR